MSELEEDLNTDITLFLNEAQLVSWNNHKESGSIEQWICPTAEECVDFFNSHNISDPLIAERTEAFIKGICSNSQESELLRCKFNNI